MTPMIADMGERMTPGAATGTRTSAAMVQKVMAPSIQGSGSLSL